MFSCKNAPTITIPLKSYVIELRYDEIAVGDRNFNYKDKTYKVGEWVDDTKIDYIPIHEAPHNLFCISLKDWLEEVKPKMKKGSMYFNRKRKSNRR